MSAALNNVTTQDAYKDGTTLQAPGTVRVNLQVFNAAIYWQHSPGYAGAAASWEPVEPGELLAPGFHSFDLVCTGVRVKSAAVGKPAQVTIVCRTDQEVPGA